MEEVLKELLVAMAAQREEAEDQFKQSCEERERIMKLISNQGEGIAELENRVNVYLRVPAKIGLR